MRGVTLPNDPSMYATELAPPSRGASANPSAFQGPPVPSRSSQGPLMMNPTTGSYEPSYYPQAGRGIANNGEWSWWYWALAFLAVVHLFMTITAFVLAILAFTELDSFKRSTNKELANLEICCLTNSNGLSSMGESVDSLGASLTNVASVSSSSSNTLLELQDCCSANSESILSLQSDVSELYVREEFIEQEILALQNLTAQLA